MGRVCVCVYVHILANPSSPWKYRIPDTCSPSQGELLKGGIGKMIERKVEMEGEDIRKGGERCDWKGKESGI